MSAATITLAGREWPLVWNKGALFRADELNLFHQPDGTGFTQGLKYLWCMLPDEARRLYPAPIKLAEVAPPILTVQTAINAAIQAAGEEMDEKKIVGSTNGLSPASSSDLAAPNTGA